MVRIVNNIAGTAMCFFVPATHFFTSTQQFLKIAKLVSKLRKYNNTLDNDSKMSPPSTENLSPMHNKLNPLIQMVRTTKNNEWSYVGLANGRFSLKNKWPFRLIDAPRNHANQPPKNAETYYCIVKTSRDSRVSRV